MKPEYFNFNSAQKLGCYDEIYITITNGRGEDFTFAIGSDGMAKMVKEVESLLKEWVDFPPMCQECGHRGYKTDVNYKNKAI
jgi:hypothetical protein